MEKYKKSSFYIKAIELIQYLSISELELLVSIANKIINKYQDNK